MEQLAIDLAHASAVVKLFTGVGNNAAWLVCLEALDHARKCSTYRHGVKRAFKQCVEEFHAYERRLLFAEENRMFHLADFAPNVRAKYGNISDREFYDFWSSMGAPAYERSRPWLTSLQNKYRLSLVAHNVVDSGHVAWVMVAMCGLEIARKMYDTAINDICAGYNISHNIADRAFRGLKMDGIREAWSRALFAISPTAHGYDLDEVEERNIEQGIQQLQDSWLNADTLMKSTITTVEDYAEIFANRKEYKTALKNLKKNV